MAVLISASVALLSQPAMAAKGAKKFHEEEWKKTKTYGNTIIAEDSTSRWGPWEKFIQPAAGPLTIAPMPGMPADGARYYRPGSVDEFSPKYSLAGGDVGACQSGEWCGYMAYTIFTDGPGSEEGIRAGRIGLSLKSAEIPGAFETNGTAAYRFSDLNDPNTVVYESGEVPVKFWYLSNYASDFGVPDHIFLGFYPVALAEDGQSTSGMVFQLAGAIPRGGPFVAGIATPLEEMANFNAGSVVAAYRGHTADNNTPIIINVQFGPGTWDGTWGVGGVDGSDIHIDTSSSGKKYITGDVGFTAEGTINGSNIQSTSVSAADAITITGTVDGTFFGNSAEVLGGISDITKTTAGYVDAQNIDIFTTCAGTPCAAPPLLP